ncbi:putative RNA-binding protein Luc7-like 1 [Nowakowskiella sp. JEL0407]|nr:putative RNA-binding protein Luc7-like 1 [Nowakowskiella sp. JEL0407]
MPRNANSDVLSQLMAGLASEPSAREHFTDKNVCKLHLINLCPSDLFTNTKSDVGACREKHSAALKLAYDNAIATGSFKESDLNYEWYSSIKSYLSKVDSQISRSSSAVTLTDSKTEQLQKEIVDITSEVTALNEQIELLGESGDLEKSVKLLSGVEERMELIRRKELEIKNHTEYLKGSQENKLRVCEVCAAMLSVSDNDRRLADHFSGRMHQGHVLLRNKFKELSEVLKKDGELTRREEQNSRDVYYSRKSSYERRRSRSPQHRQIDPLDPRRGDYRDDYKRGERREEWRDNRSDSRRGGADLRGKRR